MERKTRRHALARVAGSGAAAALMLGSAWLLTSAPAAAASTTEQFVTEPRFTG